MTDSVRELRSFHADAVGLVEEGVKINRTLGVVDCLNLALGTDPGNLHTDDCKNMNVVFHSHFPFTTSLALRKN